MHLKDNRFARSTDIHSYNNISNTYPPGYRNPTVSSFTLDATWRKRKQSLNIKLYLEDEKFNMLDQPHNEQKNSAKEDVSNSKLPNLNEKQKRKNNYANTAIISRPLL